MAASVAASSTVYGGTNNAGTGQLIMAPGAVRDPLADPLATFGFKATASALYPRSIQRLLAGLSGVPGDVEIDDMVFRDPELKLAVGNSVDGPLLACVRGQVGMIAVGDRTAPLQAVLDTDVEFTAVAWVEDYLVVGDSAGTIRLFDQNGVTAFTQPLMLYPILCIQATSCLREDYTSTQPSISIDLWVLHSNNLLSSLPWSLIMESASRRLAMLDSRERQQRIPRVPYKKWELDMPAAVTTFTCVAPMPHVVFNLYEKLPQTTLIVGSSNMFIAAVHVSTSPPPPSLSSMASALATKLTAAVFGFAKSWVWGAPQQPTETEDAMLTGEGEDVYLEPDAKVREPVVQLERAVSLSDEGRIVEKTSVAPTRDLFVTVDNFGRVMLITQPGLLVLRMWKGYRDAQVGWLHCVDRQDGAAKGMGLYLVLYAPRREVVEIWRMKRGPRVASIRVPGRCLLIQPPFQLHDTSATCYVLRLPGNSESKGVDMDSQELHLCQMSLPKASAMVLGEYFTVAANEKDGRTAARISSLLGQIVLWCQQQSPGQEVVSQDTLLLKEVTTSIEQLSSFATLARVAIAIRRAVGLHASHHLAVTQTLLRRLAVLVPHPVGQQAAIVAMLQDHATVVQVYADVLSFQQQDTEHRTGIKTFAQSLDGEEVVQWMRHLGQPTEGVLHPYSIDTLDVTEFCECFRMRQGHRMLASEASLHIVARFLFSLLCVDTIALQTVLRAQSALGFTVDTLGQMFLSWFFDADMITLIHTPAAPGMNPICRWLSTQCELGNGAAMFANMMTAALTHVDVERALLLATLWRVSVGDDAPFEESALRSALTTTRTALMLRSLCVKSGVEKMMPAVDWVQNRCSVLGLVESRLPFATPDSEAFEVVEAAVIAVDEWESKAVDVDEEASELPPVTVPADNLEQAVAFVLRQMPDDSVDPDVLRCHRVLAFLSRWETDPKHIVYLRLAIVTASRICRQALHFAVLAHLLRRYLSPFLSEIRYALRDQTFIDTTIAPAPHMYTRWRPWGINMCISAAAFYRIWANGTPEDRERADPIPVTDDTIISSLFQQLPAFPLSCAAIRSHLTLLLTMYVAYTDKQPVNVNSLAPNGPDSELFTVESVLAAAGSIGFIHRRWLDDHSVETISGGELGFGDSTSWWGQEPAAKSYVIRNHRLQFIVRLLNARSLNVSMLALRLAVPLDAAQQLQVCELYRLGQDAEASETLGQLPSALVESVGMNLFHIGRLRLAHTLRLYRRERANMQLLVNVAPETLDWICAEDNTMTVTPVALSDTYGLLKRVGGILGRDNPNSQRVAELCEVAAIIMASQSAD